MESLSARTFGSGASGFRKAVKLAACIPALSACFVSGCSDASEIRAPFRHGSLCLAKEVLVFNCRTGRKIASVCGQSPGRAVFRFGTPERIEVQSTGLHHAGIGFSGGGETQIYAGQGSRHYVLFERMVRTGFAGDGRHDPQFSNGLLVKRDGKAVFSTPCRDSEDRSLIHLAPGFMPEGQYVEH
jgi:hypothetical protein